MRWSEQDKTDLLYKRDKLGMPFSAIGANIGRTKSACISKYQQLIGKRKGRLYVPTGKYNG